MGFWQKPIITRKRKKQLDIFRKAALWALDDLAKKAPNEDVRFLYERMAHNVKNTRIVFHDRKNLKEKIFRFGGRIVGKSVTKGEHVNTVTIQQMGDQKFMIKDDYINLPAHHVFDGEKLSIDGIFTLAHEYGHFPKGENAESFAVAYGLSESQSEELLADLLSAKLAARMGYPKDRILHHFRGREAVYGGYPFKEMIRKAVE